MSFQFPLATVLKVREMVEEREERLLQQILFEILQVRQGLEGIRQKMGGFDAALRADIHQRSTGYDLHAAYGEKQRLMESREEFEGKLEKLEQLRDQQLVVFEAARRNREMLTDMREEQRDAYQMRAAKREQKTLDDNYVARRGRV